MLLKGLPRFKKMKRVLKFFL